MSSDKRILSPRISYEQAKPVILSLIAGGKAQPSAKDLYLAMGHGSLGTHQKHIDRYREEEQTVRTVELSMPADAQEFYLRTLRRQLAEARQGLEEELLQLRQDKAILVEESERLSEELEDTRTSGRELSEQLQQKLGAIEQMQSELEQGRKATHAAKEEARIAIEDAKDEALLQIREIRGESERYRLDAQETRTALAKAELRLEAMPAIEAERKALAEECRQERETRHTAERNAALSAQKLEAAEALSEQMRDELASVRKDCRQEQEKRHAAERDMAMAEGRQQSASLELNRFQQELNDALKNKGGQNEN